MHCIILGDVRHLADNHVICCLADDEMCSSYNRMCTGSDVNDHDYMYIWSLVNADFAPKLIMNNARLVANSLNFHLFNPIIFIVQNKSRVRISKYLP